MSIRCVFKKLSTVISVCLILTASAFAQSSKCDLRLDVFLLQKSDYPQNTPIKSATATAINLENNVVLTPRLKSGVPYFAKLPEGKYNLVVGKDGFSSTVKQINLDCRLTDEKNVFDEIIFLTDKKNKNHRMWQIDYKVAGAFPSPPSTVPKSNPMPTVIAHEIAVNERAVYLPSPVFSPEVAKTRNELISELTSFVIAVNVKTDKEGNVVAADAESDFKKLLPAVIESAKKAKFASLKVKGKPAALQGRLIYSLMLRKDELKLFLPQMHTD